MKRVVVLSGAGISRESGLQTFRDGDGLWEGYHVQDVATPEGWKRDPDLVQRFYNERRRAVLNAQPNEGHRALVKLAESFQVEIITQNIDDLHERAGSSFVMHLHGEIRKSQSSVDPELVYPIEGSELTMGEICERGSQLRPHVVWFGESVPMMDSAIARTEKADVLVLIGTSLVVYPAASLIEYVSPHVAIHVVDPKIPPIPFQLRDRVHEYPEPASSGVPKMVKALIEGRGQ